MGSSQSASFCSSICRARSCSDILDKRRYRSFTGSCSYCASRGEHEDHYGFPEITAGGTREHAPHHQHVLQAGHAISIFFGLPLSQAAEDRGLAKLHEDIGVDGCWSLRRIASNSNGTSNQRSGQGSFRRAEYHHSIRSSPSKCSSLPSLSVTVPAASSDKET